MSKYNDIEFCLSLLHKIVYEQKDDLCIEFKKTSLPDIQIGDLKKPNGYDPKKILENDFIFDGYFNDRWHFKKILKKNEDFNYSIAVGVYDDTIGLTYNDLRRSEIFSMMAAYTLSEIVINDDVNHILLPIVNFDITLKMLEKYNPKIMEIISKDKSLFKNELQSPTTKQPMLYVMVTEEYHETMTLKEYITQNHKSISNEQWKVIFFQIFYALTKILEKYGKFRHGNLTAQSVRVCLDNVKTGDKKYSLHNVDFTVPNIGLTIKFTDFDKCYLDDTIINVNSEKTNENPFYDIFMITYDIYKLLIDIGDTNNLLMSFFQTIIPEKFQKPGVTINNDLIESISEIQIPHIVLKKNNFFSQFINNTMELSSESEYVSPVKSRVIKKKKPGVEYFAPSSEESSLTESSDATGRSLGKPHKGTSVQKREEAPKIKETKSPKVKRSVILSRSLPSNPKDKKSKIIGGSSEDEETEDSVIDMVDSSDNKKSQKPKNKKNQKKDKSDKQKSESSDDDELEIDLSEDEDVDNEEGVIDMVNPSDSKHSSSDLLSELSSDKKGGKYKDAYNPKQLKKIFDFVNDFNKNIKNGKNQSMQDDTHSTVPSTTLLPAPDHYQNAPIGMPSSNPTAIPFDPTNMNQQMPSQLSSAVKGNGMEQMMLQQSRGNLLPQPMRGMPQPMPSMPSMPSMQPMPSMPQPMQSMPQAMQLQPPMDMANNPSQISASLIPQLQQFSQLPPVTMPQNPFMQGGGHKKKKYVIINKKTDKDFFF